MIDCCAFHSTGGSLSLACGGDSASEEHKPKTPMARAKHGLFTARRALHDQLERRELPKEDQGRIEEALGLTEDAIYVLGEVIRG